MKSRPESVRDMAWAAQQQAGNAITTEYRNAMNDPTVGALSHTEVNVTAWEYKDEIEVSRSTYRYKEPLKTGGWSLEGEHETLARLSFEEFKDSEWWDPYIEKTKYQNCDSSWMDSFNVDADEDHAEINFECPEFKKVWWCSSEVPSGRIAKCRVYVGGDGILYLKFGKEDEEASIVEFIEAVRRLRELDEEYAS